MKKVLIIDDDKEVLMALNFALMRKGYGVKVLLNSIDIMREILEYGPDVILLDVFLGESDGRLISKKVKETEETKEIQIILISGSNLNEEQLEESKADGFIGKPININEVTESINSFRA